MVVRYQECKKHIKDNLENIYILDLPGILSFVYNSLKPQFHSFLCTVYKKQEICLTVDQKDVKTLFGEQWEMFHPVIIAYGQNSSEKTIK